MLELQAQIRRCQPGRVPVAGIVGGDRAAMQLDVVFGDDDGEGAWWILTIPAAQAVAPDVDRPDLARPLQGAIGLFVPGHSYLPESLTRDAALPSTSNVFNGP